MAKYSVYSLADLKVVMYHKDVGRIVLSSQGLGKIGISYSGDMSSHTATADGFVVINRLRTYNGQLTLEVPQNSSADEYLRKWARYLKNVKKTNQFAKTTLNIVDQAGNFTIYCEGVTPQKIPDRTYDQASSNLTWVLLAASITESK